MLSILAINFSSQWLYLYGYIYIYLSSIIPMSGSCFFKNKHSLTDLKSDV